VLPLRAAQMMTNLFISDKDYEDVHLKSKVFNNSLDFILVRPVKLRQ